MLEVSTIRNGDVKGVRFDTDRVSIMDGCLIILDRDEHMLAGFAPGTWLTFEYIKE